MTVALLLCSMHCHAVLSLNLRYVTGPQDHQGAETASSSCRAIAA